MKKMYRSTALAGLVLGLMGSSALSDPSSSVETVIPLNMQQGLNPDGITSDRFGNLYLRDPNAGIHCCLTDIGSVYKLSPPTKGSPTWVETTVATFGGEPITGGYNAGGYSTPIVLDSKGNIYGGTSSGGTGKYGPYNSGAGTIYQLTPPTKTQSTWTESVIYNNCSLPNCRDGFRTSGLVIDNKGVIYGNDSNGIFKLTKSSNGNWTKTTIYSTGAANLIPDNKGNLYGIITNNSQADIVKLTPHPNSSLWTKTIIYSFFNISPYSGQVLISDGNEGFYGTTYDGGINNVGTIFKLIPPLKNQNVWTETVLYNFKGSTTFPGNSTNDGANPNGLVIDNGVLYGTTNQGGLNVIPLTAGYVYPAFGTGTVFRLTPPEKRHTVWTETILYRFCSQPNSNCADGTYPSGALVLNNNSLYGTTEEPHQHLLFELTLPSPRHPNP
jgi:hypothetical protein